MQQKKILSFLVAALLVISMGIALLPNTMAHSPPINQQTWSFCSASPNPCGLGQSITVGFWLQQPPNTANGISGDRWTGMKVNVIKPDGTNDTLGPFTSDDTGGTYAIYTPTQLGNYSFQMIFPGQVLTGSTGNPGFPYTNNAYVNDTFLPSLSNVATVTVQQSIVAYLPTTPLPTEYWTRPINAMNYNWYSIAGNWLGGPNALYRVDSMYNPYTTGPESAHILWTKPESPGGTVGGDFGNDLTGNYYTNRQYEKPYMPIIINGVLYYTQYPGSTSYPVAWVAVDLKTGQELWRNDATNLGGGNPAQSALTSNGQVTSLLMGQVLNYITPNQYGGSSYLWSTGTPAGITAVKSGSTTYNMFDAMTGMYILSVVNGSSMTITRDEHDNLIGYYVNSTVASAPTLNCWNSTQCILSQLSGGLTSWRWQPTQNGKFEFKNGIMWTKPLPTNISGGAFPATLSIWTVLEDTVLLCAPAPAAGSFQGGFNIECAFDASDGTQLFLVNRTETPNTRLSSGTSYSMTFGDGVYVQYNFDTFVATGYNLRTGVQMWTTALPGPNVYDMHLGCGGVADGVLYLLGLGGDVYALNVQTGKILWKQTTNAVQGSAESNTPYGVWPVWTRECSFTIADGKLYFGEGHEYSPPLFRGAREICLNATTGEPIWNVLQFAVESAAPIADGVMTTLNGYDNQIYAFGTGPSKTTVNVPNPVVTVGAPIVIQGTITDVSAGTKQDAVASNFPNGLPCVSDDSQTGFMESVYEQQTMPTNVTGVPITLYVIDANGNYRAIGTATSDAYGSYSLTWSPDIAGNYKVIAAFAGTHSYYGSTASSSFYVSEPAATHAPAATAAPSMSDQYFLPAVIGLFVAIVVVGLLTIVMLRKHP